ncbi:AAA family ATPase [Sphaerotilus sp.]|uniref:AAA family ATPase n=1 Tax=Sphaerotilus sp. TaxID=2093942 RepID=UPI002ACEA2AE|nr:AAA family ATPase [Sphaerotilus sp.]MDZ7857440.1 AAA family ATPase [Sphaerotilus sp.]
MSTTGMTLIDTLRSHVESHYPALYLVTHEESEADALIRTLAADGERRIVEWNLARGLVDFETRQPKAAWCNLTDALDNLLQQDFTRDTFIVIRDAHLGLHDAPVAVARLKALIARNLADDECSVTVFLVSSQPCVPPELEKFITLFDLPLPDEAAIQGEIRKYVDAYGLTIEGGTLAKLTNAFQGLTRYEIGQLINRGFQQDGRIDLDDIDLVHAEKRQIIRKSGTLEMLEVRERLDDIGGLEKLKPWLKQKAAVLADWPAARAFGVEPPKGVMIVGMPGCGKSLTAKAAATLFNLPLLKLDMGSMMGKYVGESEANMRRALRVAEAVSPCVLWVDEVEKAFVGVGRGGGSSDVATRLFGYFLTWMQEKTQQVFVIGTANDVSSLPPELLRKGRFDEVFYVDFPKEAERAEIFRVHLNKRKKLGNGVQVDRLAKATDGYSGADIEAIVKEAIEQAFVAGGATIDTERLLAVIKATHPLRDVMKDKVKEYRDRFDAMKIKEAS